MFAGMVAVVVAAMIVVGVEAGTDRDGEDVAAEHERNDIDAQVGHGMSGRRSCWQR